MAYLRVILKGSLGAVEVFSTSAAFGIVGLAPDTPDQAEVDGIAANLRTWLTTANLPASLRSCLSSSGQFDAVRVEKRAEDETTLSVAEVLLAVPAVGNGSASKTPQDAVVLSLRTSTPGARGRGRMYMPALAVLLSGTFQINSPTAAVIVADSKTWLLAIQNQIDAYYISILSALRVRLSVRSVVDHVCRDVTSIQVGSILDTQRRRRDNLPESYVNATFP
jgi:hypothetical protein